MSVEKLDSSGSEGPPVALEAAGQPEEKELLETPLVLDCSISSSKEEDHWAMMVAKGAGRDCGAVWWHMELLGGRPRHS